jgi:hypothetical protein
VNFATACDIVAGHAPSPFLSIPEREYHADPAPAPSFSASLGKIILGKSPMHAYLAHPRLGGVKREPTEAMEWGSAIHRQILGTGSEIVVVSAKDWRGGDAKAARAEARAAGKVPLLSSDFASIACIACVFHKQFGKIAPDLYADFMAGESERVILRDFANLKGNGRVWARGMIDRVFVSIGRGEVVLFDLKTTADCSEDALTRTISAYGYDMQLACYEWLIADALPAFAGRIRSYLLFVESSAPYSLVPVELDYSFRQIGRSKLGRAWDSWCECIASGVWPSYASGVVTLSPSPWEVSRELDTEIQTH